MNVLLLFARMIGTEAAGHGIFFMKRSTWEHFGVSHPGLIAPSLVVTIIFTLISVKYITDPVHTEGAIACSRPHKAEALVGTGELKDILPRKDLLGSYNAQSIGKHEMPGAVRMIAQRAERLQKPDAATGTRNR